MEKEVTGVDLEESIELTDEFLDEISLNDILLFSHAEQGANGTPNQIKAVILKNKKINLYVGIMEDSKESKFTFKKFNKLTEPIFSSLDLEELNKNGWDCLNMGLGNSLFLQMRFSEAFRNQYDKLIEELPYYLYETWLDFTYYLIGKEFYSDDDQEILKEINRIIDSIRNDDGSF